MLETIIFGLGSLGIIILSRSTFVRLNSHALPRFFAFEALLGLVVVNAQYWFTRPFSLAQIISWALLLDAIFLALHAFWVLHKYGMTDTSIKDASRVGFEKTTHLVEAGPYQFIRHPMYASLLCLAGGAFLKQINILSCTLLIVVAVSLFLTAIYEERENLQIFGEEYARYMRLTKRFIPFVF